MRIKLSHFFTAFTAVFLFALTSTAVQAASFTVTALEDEADGSPVCVTGSSTDCSLREAIILANATAGEDTIIIPEGTYTLSVAGTDEDSAATGDLDITDTDGVTITGADSVTTVIDANGIDRVFDVVSGAVASFGNLTITGGNVGSAGNGAGVLSDGDLQMDDVVVSNNTIVDTDAMSSAHGAGVYCVSGSLEILNSTIATNGSSTEYIKGGGVAISNTCNATVDRTTFDGNLSNDYAGGMYVHASAGTNTTVTNAYFTDNAAMYGGGLFLAGGSGYLPIELESVTFANNISEGGGGGLYVGGAMRLTNATITNNLSDDSGGGIYVIPQNYAQLSISHATIVENQSDADNNASGDGGGMYIGLGSTVSVQGTILAANTRNMGSGPNCSGQAQSGGYNYVGDNFNCNGFGGGGPAATDQVNESSLAFITSTDLADNGGYVPTLLLNDADIIDEEGEADCDAADNTPLTTDARGNTRPDNNTCDIGAVELDQTAPSITVTGSNPASVECSASYTDAGATAEDILDGVVDSDTFLSTVDTAVPGTYAVDYAAVDTAGNEGTASRTVHVVDTVDPVISLVGASTINLQVGDAYVEQGATAEDTCDNSVSVTVGGDTVDVNTPGTYVIEYNAEDDSTNAATTVTREVIVTALPVDDDEEVDDDSDIDDDSDTDSEVDNDTDAEISSELDVRTNGRNVNVFVGDTLVDSKKVSKKAIKKKFRALKVGKLYGKKPYSTVAFVGVRKETATLTIFRLTPNNTLTKKSTYTFDTVAKAKPVIKFNKKKKRIVVTVGKGDNQVRQVFRVTKTGKLVQVSEQSGSVL